MNVKKVACIGSGVIGASWGSLFAAKGYAVSCHATREASLTTARERVERTLDSMAGLGLFGLEEAKEAKDRVSYTTDYTAALQGADFIQENTPDSIDLKIKVLKEIETHASPATVIASSTSNLLISDIAKHARNPERCIGAHPYNPPHLMPLVEITRTQQTNSETINTAVSFFRSCNKVPVVLQKESLGFVSNRLQMALYREAVNIVMNGICTVEEVDNVTTFGPALRWAILGPNMLFQLGGGEGGLKGLLTQLKDSGDNLIADLSTISYQPQEWLDIGQAGVVEEMKNMPEYIGNTQADIAAFRDRMLIQLLKMHHKL